MKLLLIICLLLFTTLCFPVLAQERQVIVPYTLADRDRAIRTEARMESLEGKVQALEGKVQTMDSGLTKKIDRLEDKFDSYFMWGFGLVLISIFGLIGFVIYDRRTTLAPVENKTERIIKALREAAEKDPSLREALKRTALW